MCVCVFIFGGKIVVFVIAIHCYCVMVPFVNCYLDVVMLLYCSLQENADCPNLIKRVKGAIEKNLATSS